jgi:hypothetical protein
MAVEKQKGREPKTLESADFNIYYMILDIWIGW